MRNIAYGLRDLWRNTSTLKNCLGNLLKKMYLGEQNGGGTCNGPESLLLEITKNFMVAVALMIRKIYYLDTCV